MRKGRFLSQSQLPQRALGFHCGTLQHGQSLSPEVSTQEEGEERPEAGVAAGQDSGDYQGCEQRVLGPVSPDRVHDERDVERCPAEKEEAEQGQEDHEGPVLQEAFGAVAQPQQDAEAADEQGAHRQEEAQHVVEQAGHQN